MAELGPNQLRLSLESLRSLTARASKLFERRNALILRFHSQLQAQLFSLVGSIALALYLGFQMRLPFLIIFITVLTLAILVLKIKVRLIQVRKKLKVKEPEVAEGSLLATIKRGECQFYKVDRKSDLFFYLVPVDHKEVLVKYQLGDMQFNEFPNKKTLFLRKKRVFEYFYQVSPTQEGINYRISA